MQIARESSEHYAPTRDVIVDAFSGSEFGHNGEAELVEILRGFPQEYFGLVAIEQGQVTGHIAFSTATMTLPSKQELQGMGLGPVAVAPVRQQSGIGIALIEQGIRVCRERNAEFIVVAGDPSYYSRFGFRLASEFGIVHGFEGMPQEVLQLMLLTADSPRNDSQGAGRVCYHAAFGPQFENADID